nr:serine/arginine repetitive matrix protein 2-like [Ipomoea batatas]
MSGSKSEWFGVKTEVEPTALLLAVVVLSRGCTGTRRFTLRRPLSPSQLFGDQSLPSENKGQLPCHIVKSLLPSAAFILGIRMSDSDSQNVSGRDYDEGDEAVSESFSPSTGGSTFNQIDEVEHVSPNAEENKGPLRPTASTEDVSSSGRGKSPRVVVSKMFPHLSPRTVEEVTVSIRWKGVPRELQALGRNLGPEASSRPRALPAPGEASSSAPNPRPSSVSHAPAVTSSSDLNPTEADQTADESSATRKKMLFLNSELPKADLSSHRRGHEDLLGGMSPNRTFIAPAAAPRPKTKVALGAKRAAAKPTVDPPIVDVPDPAPTDASSGGGATSLHPRRPDKGQGARHGDHHRVVVQPARRADRRGYRPGIREKEVVPLQKQVSAADRRIQELEKELAAAEDRAEKAEKKLGEVEGRAERAEQAEKEAIDKMKDASSLARFICTDEAIAKEFLIAFINTEEKVHTALTEGLEETDLPAVLALLPSEVADPGPRPYSKPGPSE